MQQLSYDGAPRILLLSYYCDLPVNEAVAVERVLPAHPIVEVHLDLQIWIKTFWTLLFNDDKALLSDDGGMSTNPASIRSNGCLIHCALQARSEATVEIRMTMTI